MALYGVLYGEPDAKLGKWSEFLKLWEIDTYIYIYPSLSATYVSVFNDTYLVSYSHLHDIVTI